MFFLIFWILFGVARAMIGARKGEPIVGFILGIFLGPIGLLIVALSKGNRQDCPFCRELIRPGATICPHCRNEIAWVRERDMHQGS